MLGKSCFELIRVFPHLKQVLSILDLSQFSVGDKCVRHIHLFCVLHSFRLVLVFFLLVGLDSWSDEIKCSLLNKTCSVYAQTWNTCMYTEAFIPLSLPSTSFQLYFYTFLMSHIIYIAGIATLVIFFTKIDFCCSL